MADSSAFGDLLEAAGNLFEQHRPLLPMYLHLILAALFPIYTGAHASLSRPSSAAKPLKDKKQDADKDEDDDDEEETIQKMEGLTPTDALVFPITAGIVLTGLYFAIKYYGADLINLILGVYFSLIGTYSVAKLINDSWTTIESFITPTYYRANDKIWRVNNSERKVIALGMLDDESSKRSSPLAGSLGCMPLPGPLRALAWSLRDLTKQKFVVKGYAKDIFNFRAVLTRHNILSTLVGVVAVTYSIFVGKPWWLTNLQGFAVSYGALQLMSPTTFATGTLILSGLFFYDIWAVFFTPLMVTVAKNLDVPIKLVFPRPEEPSATPGEAPIQSYSMLGLGDIVLPGLMIALALRFDLYMFYLRKQVHLVTSDKGSEDSTTVKKVGKVPYVTVTGHWGDRFWTNGTASSPEAKCLPAHLSTTFPKPYFQATLVGYTMGMIATLVFMSIFRHAQPALLYLVPAVLLSLWGTGLVRGELKYLWEFSEAHSMDAEEDAKLKPGEDKDKAPEEVKAGPHGGEGKGELDAGSESEQDTVFSFSVSRHKSNACKGPDQVTAKCSSSDHCSLKTAEKSKTAHGSSDSISDDAVLVSSADLDGVNNDMKPVR